MGGLLLVGVVGVVGVVGQLSAVVGVVGLVGQLSAGVRMVGLVGQLAAVQGGLQPLTDRGHRGAGAEDLGYAGRFQLGDVGGGNDPAPEDQDVLVGRPLPYGLDDPGEQ